MTGFTGVSKYVRVSKTPIVFLPSREHPMDIVNGNECWGRMTIFKSRLTWMFLLLKCRRFCAERIHMETRFQTCYRVERRGARPKKGSLHYNGSRNSFNEK